MAVTIGSTSASGAAMRSLRLHMTTLSIGSGGTKLAHALIDTQRRVLEKQTLPTSASSN